MPRGRRCRARSRPPAAARAGHAARRSESPSCGSGTAGRPRGPRRHRPICCSLNRSSSLDGHGRPIRGWPPNGQWIDDGLALRLRLRPGREVPRRHAVQRRQSSRPSCGSSVKATIAAHSSTCRADRARPTTPTMLFRLSRARRVPPRRDLADTLDRRPRQAGHRDRPVPAASREPDDRGRTQRRVLSRHARQSTVSRSIDLRRRSGPRGRR